MTEAAGAIEDFKRRRYVVAVKMAYPRPQVTKVYTRSEVGSSAFVEVRTGGLLDWLMGELLIQDALPELTPAERELLMTGYTQEDWDQIDQIFPPEGDE